MSLMELVFLICKIIQIVLLGIGVGIAISAIRIINKRR